MKRLYRFLKRFNLAVSTLRNCVWLLVFSAMLTGSQLPDPFAGLQAPGTVLKANSTSKV